MTYAINSNGVETYFDISNGVGAFPFFFAHLSKSASYRCVTRRFNIKDARRVTLE